MALTLYHGAPNGPSLSVLAALFETGLDAELRFIDLASGERYSAGIPMNVETAMSIEGEGPVLVADGEAMADSVFIGCYLADRAPGAGLRPADPYKRWQMMAWCRWAIERLAPASAALGNLTWTYPRLSEMVEDNFEAILALVESSDLRDRWVEVRHGTLSDAHKADSEAKVRAAAERVDTQLADGREWIIGDFSLADLETYAWLAPMQGLLGDAFAGKPHLAAWLERMRGRASVSRAIGLSRSGMAGFAFAPGPEINRWG